MATLAALSAAARHHVPRGLCPRTPLVRSRSRSLAPPSPCRASEQRALVVIDEQRHILGSEQQLAAFGGLPVNKVARAQWGGQALVGRRGAVAAAPGFPDAHFDSRMGGIMLFADRPRTPQSEKPEEDPNRVKLGDTLRILRKRMPTLLQSPLPQEILSPRISLHLFPSTHPHLPTVSGRVAYNAALWTSPIAWNRLPLVGNVRLHIISERMTSDPLPFGGPQRTGAVSEKLVVRWRTMEKNGDGDGAAAAGKEKGKQAFTGLFIFQFDTESRVLSHTIEHAQTGHGWEMGIGARMVGLTDWLLGGMRGEGQPEGV